MVPHGAIVLYLGKGSDLGVCSGQQAWQSINYHIPGIPSRGAVRRLYNEENGVTESLAIV